MKRISRALALAVVVALAGAAQASDPLGGYMTVDKVILVPSEAPTKIQIWGSFVFATNSKGRAFTEPVRGYLYYQASKGNETVSRKEWADLKKAAGTGQVIGFGYSYERKKLGAVRRADKKPETPDTYPLGNGLVKFPADSMHKPVRTLVTFPAPRNPADGDRVPPGKITLVARNIADKAHADAKYIFTLKGASGATEVATVKSGDKETRWTPKRKLKAGEKFTWTVRAMDGDWKGPVATSAFVVKSGK
jgi:hypothetical protein